MSDKRGASPKRVGDGRDAILDAATQLFAEQGYSQTAIAGIASQSGLTRASMYEYFGSKLGLGIAVLEALASGARADWEASPARLRFLELGLALMAETLHDPSNAQQVAGILEPALEAMSAWELAPAESVLLQSLLPLTHQQFDSFPMTTQNGAAPQVAASVAENRISATIRDVAQAAGTSVKTVSRVINESSGVAAETRARVLGAMQDLHFLPNAYAQNLSRASSDIVGVIVDGLSTLPFAVEIIRGAQDAAHAQGKTLFIVDCESDPKLLDGIVRKLRAWQVTELVFVSPHHQRVRPAQLEGFGEVFLVNCVDTKRMFASVVPDEQQGAYLATNLLIRNGHRRIGFINGDPGFPATALRLQGYRKALEEAGLEFVAEYVRTGDWWQESGYREMGALMNMKARPSAVFCGNDWMAMGAYSAAQDAGLRIPEGVSIVGFDDREVIAAHMAPTLTTVALPYFEMGQFAVQRVLSGGVVPTEEEIACRLVARHSVAAWGAET